MGWFSFLKQASSSIPTPAAGKVAIFADATSGEPSYMSDDGVPHSLVGSGGGLPDAPSDGTTYGRKNAVWVDVGSAVAGVSSVNTLSGALTIAPGTNITVTPSGGDTLTIASTGGGGAANVPWKDFVADYGADPTFTSDCGAAWDAFCSDVVAHGSMALLAVGHFKFSRAFQNGSFENAQMPLPRFNYVSDAPVSIYIFGGLTPPPPVVSVITTEPDYAEGITIFESTATSGSGNLLGAGAPGSFSNIFVVIRNALFRTVANPTYTAVNLENAACADLDGVLIDTGEINVAGVTTPTTTTSYGLKLPANNNGANTRLGTVDVVGFYNAFLFGEHSVGIQAKAWAAINAYVFAAGNHASTFLRMLATHCKNGIVGPASGAHVVNIQQYDAEHAASGPFTPVYDINDPADTLYGDLKWRIVDAGVGGSLNFFVNGAHNFEFKSLVFSRLRTVTTTSDTPAITDSGNVIDCTNASATTVTIPQNSSVPWKLGTVLTWVQKGAGQITVVAGTSVTIRVPDSSTTRKQYSTVQAVCVATNEWVLSGDFT